MPIKLTLFLLVLCNFSYAQIEGFRSPTPFDKFITLEKIQWAAYYNDTLTLDKYNLSDQLFKRFQGNEIKVSLPVHNDYFVKDYIQNNKIRYTTKKKLEESLPISLALPVYDSSGNILSDLSPKKSSNRVDSNSYNKIDIEQILYIVNGKLFSYIPWASPKLSVYTSQNIFLGTTRYFTTCYNFKYNYKSAPSDKIYFIKTTKRKILLDSIPRVDMLKQLYGRNILEAIWKDLINVKNEFTNLRNDKKISLEELKRYSYSNENPIPLYNSLARVIGYGTVSVPIYDSLGRITRYQDFTQPLSPSHFPQIELTQNWYYNYTKNVIVNSITDITLFAINKDTVYSGELEPVLKITLK